MYINTILIIYLLVTNNCRLNNHYDKYISAITCDAFIKDTNDESVAYKDTDDKDVTADSNGKYPFGTIAKVTCKTGFSGNPTSTCDGTWPAVSNKCTGMLVNLKKSLHFDIEIVIFFKYVKFISIIIY